MSDSIDRSAAAAGLARYQARRTAGLVQIRTPTQKAIENPTSMRCAINAKCFDCVCFQKREITLCTMYDCPLWNFRPYQNAKVKEEDFDE